MTATVHRFQKPVSFKGSNYLLPSFADQLSCLTRHFDVRCALFLAHAARLSQAATKSGGWFFLPQAGDSLPGASDPFRRSGSWKALGCGSSPTQKLIRANLCAAGLLEERRRGLGRANEYRVDVGRYAAFINRDNEFSAPRLRDAQTTSASVPDEIRQVVAECAKAPTIRNPAAYQKWAINEYLKTGELPFNQESVSSVGTLERHETVDAMESERRRNLREAGQAVAHWKQKVGLIEAQGGAREAIHAARAALDGAEEVFQRIKSKYSSTPDAPVGCRVQTEPGASRANAEVPRKH